MAPLYDLKNITQKLENSKFMLSQYSNVKSRCTMFRSVQRMNFNTCASFNHRSILRIGENWTHALRSVSKHLKTKKPKVKRKNQNYSPDDVWALSIFIVLYFQWQILQYSHSFLFLYTSHYHVQSSLTIRWRSFISILPIIFFVFFRCFVHCSAAILESL